MVKKKYTSKRQTLKDKYKIQRRVVEHNRKQRKQAKKDAKNGVIKHKKKDPGIPNSWPFKAQLLEEIAHAKEVEAQRKEQQKNQKRTIVDVMKDAAASQAAFASRTTTDTPAAPTTSATSSTPAGEQSRRAYLRELKKVIDSADVLLQILDARDPIGTRASQSTEDAILSRSDKKMVLVLNKVDLVPKEAIQGWLTHLRHFHPTVAVKAGNGQHKAGGSVGRGEAEDLLQTTSAVGMEGLLQLIKNYARSDGVNGSKSKTCVSVGVIGYPNVGKSSIINSLKRERAVGVSPRPGFTTALQEVVLDKTVRLLDSPGVVFEDDANVLLKNCVSVDDITDPHDAVEALLNRCSLETVMMTYALPRFNSVDMFLAMIAKKYGKVLKGGIPNKVAAGKIVLKDWNSGKIPYFTPPPQYDTAVECSKGQAQIVTQFGTAFKVCDEEIIKTLNETDEVEFVRLKEGGRTERNILEGDADDSTEMEMEDADGENKEGNDSDGMKGVSLVKNEAMADADDFDFASM